MERINIGTYAFGMGSSMTLLEKLKAAKEMGYTGIELLANDLQNNTVEQLKAVLAESGMECVSSHVAYDLMEELLPKFAELGGKMMMVPMYAFANKEEALELAAKLEKMGEFAKQYNVKIGYHNHNQEFFVDEGKPILEYLIENTTPGTVWFQLDCGWAAAGGANPAEFINKYPGRFISIHVKENNQDIGPGQPRSSKEPPMQRPKMELDADGKPIMSEEMKKMMASMRERMKIQCPMGDASSRIDWKAVKAATDAQGVAVEWTVEREYDYLGDMNKCLAEDVAWLKANI